MLCHKVRFLSPSFFPHLCPGQPPAHSQLWGSVRQFGAVWLWRYGAFLRDSPGPPHGSGWDAGLHLALRMGRAGMLGFAWPSAWVRLGCRASGRCYSASIGKGREGNFLLGVFLIFLGHSSKPLRSKLAGLLMVRLPYSKHALRSLTDIRKI